MLSLDLLRQEVKGNDYICRLQRGLLFLEINAISSCIILGNKYNSRPLVLVTSEFWLGLRCFY